LQIWNICMEISSARVNHWAEHYPGAAAAENSWNCHLKLRQKSSEVFQLAIWGTQIGLWLLH
jgi:hypothetical protein